MTADSPSLSELLEHREFLERFARNLARDPAVADDVVQETWLTALERPPRQHGDLRAWLRRVARNVFLQRLRARTSASHVDASSVEQAESRAVSPERESISELLASELLALPELYRHVLVLRYYEDKTPTEIARELDRPVNTVTSQIGRGLKLMQERLDRSHPDGRSRWLPVVLALARGRQRDASRPDGRVPVAGSIGVARAAAALLVALAAVVAVVLVLRAPARVPVSAPEGTLVAEGESTLVAPASPDGRTLEPIDVAGATAPDAPPAAAAPLLATVVVDVVGPDGPVAGAWVRVARDESPKGASVPMIKFGDDHETDRDGRAEFRVGDEQRVRFGAGEADALMVLVQAEGFEISDSQSVPFPESGTVAMTFRLTPASTIVRGRVTDEDGEPVEGALVSVGSSVDRQIDLGDGRSRVQRDPIKETRADGTFQHDGLPPGTLRLQVQHPGFSPHAAWISVMDGSATVHDVVLRRGSLVAGRVTTADGRPASGASVRAEFLAGGPELTVQEAVADDDGRFEVRGLAQAPTWLFAQHAEQSSLTAATHLEVEQQTTHEWNPVLEERPPLLLRVQREDGSPLSGALVALHTTAATESAAWQRFRATDAGGRVRFELVPATDLTAMVYRTLEDRDRGVPACHGQQGLHAAADEQALTVPAASLDRGGLCGVLLDQDGKPFDDAVLQIRSRPGPFFVPTPVSAETGEFEARNLPTQLYDVVVWCVGMGTVPLGPIEVFANDTFDLGEVSLPEPSSWSPSWPIPDSPAADAYELVKIDSLEDLSKRWTVTSGDAPPPPSFSLFPGKYEWNVYAKSQLVQSVTIEVR